MKKHLVTQMIENADGSWVGAGIRALSSKKKADDAVKEWRSKGAEYHAAYSGLLTPEKKLKSEDVIWG